jgi:uncharacterized damage-inducible protein DinB
MSTDTLRYPVGRFTRKPSIDAQERNALIDAIALAPEQMAAAVLNLTPQQLDTPYREGGWTVRQVVHHVVDSHLNAYVRMRLAATELTPTIKPYDENLWAELSDSRTAPIELSLPFLAALHARWVWWLRRLDAADFARRVQHPERGPMSNDDLLQLYGWHGQHHVAHITSLRDRMGW